MNKKTLIIGLAIAFVLAIFVVYGLRHIPFMKMSPEASALREAERRLSKGDEDAAIKDLETVIAKYPDSPQAQSGLFELAAIYERRSDFLKARELYQRLLERFPSSDDVSKAQEALDNVNIAILFSQTPTEDSFFYEVVKGDSLAKLAKKFGTTVELIAKANGIKNSTIRVGKRLKITKAKFSIVVDKSQNILTLKSDDGIVKTYRVSTGKNFSTPTGNFKITDKIMNPTWYTAGAVVPPDSPKNILGSRWMGISQPGYGIHGTTESQTIGRQVTAGCVRMNNADVEEVYAIVPEGTEVVIID